MGDFVTKTPDGHAIMFTIRGTEPSSTEMGRIREILAQRASGQTATAPPSDGGPGIFKSIAGGVGRGFNQMQSGADRVMQSYYEATGDKVTADEYAKSAKRNKEEGEAYAQPEGTYTPSAIAGTVGESLPGTAVGLGGAYVGGEIGAGIGALGGPAAPLTVPAGAAIGAVIGAGATFIPSMLGSNADRQIEQHGYVKDWGKAYGAAIPQAAVEGVTEVVLGKIGGVLLKPFRAGTKPASDAVKRAVDKGIKGATTYAAKKIGPAAAITAVSGATEEVIQQGLERWQAELPLMDDKAKEEYIQSAIMGGIVESLFGAGAAAHGAHVDLKAGRAQRNAGIARQDAALDADADLAAARREREKGETPTYKTDPIDPVSPDEENPVGAVYDPDLVGPPPPAPPTPETTVPPGLDPEASPEARVRPARSFQTSHGSTYDLYDDGTTVRNKADHSAVGHDATDVGIKPRSSRTVYVDSNARELSSAGLTGPDGGPVKSRIVIKNGKAILLTWNSVAKRWGMLSPKEGVTVHDEPAVGRFPLELWNKQEDVKNHPDAYSGMHAGNRIVSMTEPVTPTPVIGEASLFSDADYHKTVKALTEKGKLSPDKIARELGISKATAKSYFDEIIKRGDAHPAGYRNQYIQIIPPANEAARIAEQSKRRMVGRSFEVTPVFPNDHAPYEVHIEGKKQGDAFKSQAEALDWIEQNVPAGEKKNASVVEHTSGLQHAVDDVMTEHLPGKQPREIGRKRRVYSSEAEAKAAVEGFTPALSSESNKWREEQPEEEKAAEINQDVEPIRAIMQAATDRMVGAGRVHTNVVPVIDADYARAQGVPEHQIPDEMRNSSAGTVIEGVTHKDLRGTFERVIALANDLTNPNLSQDEKTRRMAAVLNHEVIHALRHLNLLTNEEWGTLIKATHAKVPGKTYTWIQRAVARNPNLVREPGGASKLYEEAVAEMFRHYVNDPSSFPPEPRKLLAKLADFVKQLIGLGRKHDAKAVMDAIFGGEVGQRPVNYGGLPARNEGDVFFSLLKPDNFYLKSVRFLEGVKQEKAQPDQWKGMIKNAGIKQSELDWLGINDWLSEQKGPVDKRDILNFINASDGITIKLLVRPNHPLATEEHRDMSNWPQHAIMKTKGGTDYGEALFIFKPKPGEPTFDQGHYDDENVLAHVRFKTVNEIGEDGVTRKVLFIEEMQSDLHQRAGKVGGYYSETLKQDIDAAELEYLAASDIERKLREEKRILGQQKGMLLDASARNRRSIEIILRDRKNDRPDWETARNDRMLSDLYKERDRLKDQLDVLNDKVAALGFDQAEKASSDKYKTLEKIRSRMNIPNAPYKTDWEDYVIKRMFRHGAEHGFAGVAWHGQPESLAETEKYPGVRTEVDEKGRPKYFVETDATDKPPNITSIVNRYLEKLPRVVKALAQRFGAVLEQNDASPDVAAPAKASGRDGYEPPPLRTPEDLQKVFPTKLSLRIIIDKMTARRKMEQRSADNAGTTVPLNHSNEQNDLISDFGRAYQSALNMRSYDAENAFINGFGLIDFANNGSMIGDRVRDALIWTQDAGTWSDVIVSRNEPNGYKAFPWKHYRLDFNAAMQEGFERGDVPRFSMLKERAKQIEADPYFEQWFNGSVVVNPDGSPKVMYHGTRVDQPFDRFHHLTHFGTLIAAEDRIEPGGPGASGESLMEKMGIPPAERNDYWANLTQDQRDKLFDEHWQGRAERLAGSNIYPVFLNLHRPLKITDDGSNHDAFAYGLAMRDKKILSEKRFNEIMKQRMDQNNNYTKQGEQAALHDIIEHLEKAGYDGFEYINQGEDRGSTSYVALHPQQIKSIYNKGYWGVDEPDMMYSKLEERGKDLLENDDKFKKWFSGSRVVNEDGSPMLVFHGTADDFDEFDINQFAKTDHGWFGQGFYFGSDPKEADAYARKITRKPRSTKTVIDKTGGHIIPAFLSIKNPFVIEDAIEGAIFDPNESRAFTERVKKNGHDGIVIMDYDKAGNPFISTMLAFHPNQIKSALSEEFSTENDSFKFSMLEPKYAANAPMGQRVPAAPTRDRLTDMEVRMTHDNLAPFMNGIARTMGLGVKTENVIQSGIVQLQDRMQPIAKLIDMVRKNNGTVHTDSDVYQRQALFSGRVFDQIETAKRDYHDPFAKAVRALHVTQRDATELTNLNQSAKRIMDNYDNHKLGMAETYLYAQHALERNVEMARRNVKARLGEPQQTEGSGMTDYEASEILGWFAAKPFGQAFASETNRNSVRSLYRAIVRDLNDIRVEAGLNPDFRIMTKADGTPADPYKDYAPLRGFTRDNIRFDEMTEVFARAGRGFNIRGKEDRSATGRGIDPITGRPSLASDLVSNIILMHQESIVRAEKNRVAQSFDQLLTDNPKQLAFIAEFVPANPTKYAYNRSTGLVQERVDQTIPNDPMVLKYKVDGNQKYIRFQDARIAKAMGGKEGTGDTGASAVVYGIAKMTRYLAEHGNQLQP